MKKILSLILILIIGCFTVFGNSYTLLLKDEPEDASNVYEMEVEIQKGWNLIAGVPLEVEENSQISKSDLKYIYILDGNDYVLISANGEQNSKYLTQNQEFINGDGLCAVEERENIESWSYLDCKSDLSKEIINAIKIDDVSFTMSENEKNIVEFGTDKFEIYWTSASDNNDVWCDHARENNFDCFFLKYKNIGAGYEFENQVEIENSPNDGNPYNDGFVGSHILEDNSIQFFIDYSSETGKYIFNFYKLKSEDLLEKNEERLPRFEEKLYSKSSWVYVEKEGTLTYGTYFLKPKFQNLNKGWNLLSISPFFNEGKIDWNDCIVEKIYIWDTFSQDWFAWSTETDAEEKFLEEALEGDFTGQSAVVKTSNSCSLNEVLNIVAPPSIPNN